jgi:hypothetical protein
MGEEEAGFYAKWKTVGHPGWSARICAMRQPAPGPQMKEEKKAHSRTAPSTRLRAHPARFTQHRGTHASLRTLLRTPTRTGTCRRRCRHRRPRRRRHGGIRRSRASFARTRHSATAHDSLRRRRWRLLLLGALTVARAIVCGTLMALYDAPAVGTLAVADARARTCCVVWRYRGSEGARGRRGEGGGWGRVEHEPILMCD